MTGETLPALEVRGLGKKLARDLPLARKYGARDILRELRPGRLDADLRTGEFWALKDVTFDVAPGEALGVIGHNGAGKSTLLRVLHGLTRPDRGDITIRGRHAALLELGAPFNNVLSGRENIVTAAAINGISGVDVDALVAGVGDFAELGDVLDAPMWSYSNGMQMRLGYAIATQLDAQLLLVDEVLAVGDISFQRKCMQHIRQHLDRGGSLVMVSHDLWMVQAVCHRCIQLVDGEVVSDTSPTQAISRYMSRAREGKVFSPRTRTGFEAVGAAGSDLSLEVVSFAAADGGELRNGAPVAVEVEVTATAPSPPVRWHLDILMANRQVCLARVQPDSADPDGGLAVGTTRFRFEIPSLPLFPNTYYAVVHLTDRETGEELAGSPKPFPIEVHSRDTRLDVLALFAGAQSSIETTYETLTEERGASA